MSTNRSQNYNLHAWVPEDDFLLSEINENFAALDIALKAGLDAQAAALDTARSQQSAALAQHVNILNAAINQKSGVICGSYAGTYSGASTPNAAQQKITLGFQPQAVIVFANSSQVQFMALPGHTSNNRGDLLIVETDGFSACSNMSSTGANSTALTYYYLAVR